MNLEKLKNLQKRKFDRQSMSKGYSRGQHLLATKTYDPDTIKMVRASLDDQNRRERVRIIFKVMLSIFATMLLIVIALEIARLV
ncbi:MAG: hypothetical protein ACK5DD_11805 [Cyclobacteriaceae bacterium]